MSSYGLQVFGANGQTIIDSYSNSGNNEFLTVSTAPSILSNSVSEGPTSVSWDPTQQFIFLRPGNSQSEVNGRLLTSGNGTASFVIANISGYTVKYFIAELSSTAPEINAQGTTNAQEYGLEVFKTGGSSSTMFSSTKMESAINVRGAIGPGGTANNFILNRALIFSGTITGNTYVSTGYMLGGLGSSVKIGTLNFEQQAGYIYYYSVFDISFISGAPSNISNRTSLIIADLIS